MVDAGLLLRGRLQGRFDLGFCTASRRVGGRTEHSMQIYHLYAGLKLHKYQVIPRAFVYRKGCACCSLEEVRRTMEQSNRFLVCVPAYLQNTEYGSHPPG